MTKLVPSIVEVPEKEMTPAMGVGMACAPRAKLASARRMQVVFGGDRTVFILVWG